MTADITAAVIMLPRMIFLRLYRSPEGMMKNSPIAYPACVTTVMRFARPWLMPRSRLIISSSGWL